MQGGVFINHTLHFLIIVIVGLSMTCLSVCICIAMGELIQNTLSVFVKYVMLNTQLFTYIFDPYYGFIKSESGAEEWHILIIKGMLMIKSASKFI